MNQTAIGSYILKKRREKNLTQEQLAEKLSVSNKTISKWENGKSMPDYSMIEQLCKELSVTLPEPVSYTHLDVYKRQAVHSRLRRPILRLRV